MTELRARCTGQGWPAPDPLPTTVAPADDDAGRSTQRWQQQQQQQRQRTLAVANAWGECFTLDRSALAAGALCLGGGFLLTDATPLFLPAKLRRRATGRARERCYPGHRCRRRRSRPFGTAALLARWTRRFNLVHGPFWLKFTYATPVLITKLRMEMPGQGAPRVVPSLPLPAPPPRQRGSWWWRRWCPCQAGESKRLVVESPWSLFISTCQQY
eukprot:COSAG01_NODE_2639_length_7326_cov_15.912550_9_plen_214_part_00